MRNHIIKKSRKQRTFPGHESTQTRAGLLIPSSIQTLTVGPGISPGHAWELESSLLKFTKASSCAPQLVGYTTDRELHPAPKVFIWLLRLYLPGHKLHNSLAPSTRVGVYPRVFYASVRFNNAIDRANGHALG